MSRRTGIVRVAARLGWRVRRAVATVWTVGLTLGLGALVPLGGYAGLRETGAGTRGLLRLGAAIALVGLVVGKLASYLVASGIRRVERRALLGRPLPPADADSVRDLKADLELGGVLLVAAFAAVQATGGPASLLYPLVYALVAFLVTFHRLAVGLPLVGLALVLEVGLHLASGARPGLGLLLTHVAFIAFFALVHALFLQAELLRQRRAHRALQRAEIDRTRQEARDFRIISAQLGADSRTRPRAEEEAKLAQGAVETIHQALYYNLELLKKSLDLHTCVLLWLDEGGERIRIKELVTDADCVTERDFPTDVGVIGMVTKGMRSVQIDEPKRGHLPYYGEPVAIAEALAVPVIEETGHLRGVLCADRAPRAATERRKRRFDQRDEALLAGAARQILRAIQSERVFCAVERAKYEHERFYHASALLNRALTPDQVFRTAFAAAREICDFDFAAVTTFEKEGRRHTVVAVEGSCAGELTGTSFCDNAGLVAMVVKNRHYLPAGGELRDKETPVFNKKVKLQGMESLLVLPLICADEAIGSFALASSRPHFFGKDKREMLGVIANQVAVSMKNAEMYRAMEEMATTDGLTGLVNHRTFQERIADLLLRADRQGGRVSLLLTDIDHFKKVNDTYGHPTGDQVLRRVAQVCKGQVRKIDVAARYGGEEFAIVLDGTDLAGARQLAERIRAEVEKQQFTSEKGPFKCTLSLGIASFPEDGRDTKTLIHHADQALYNAKHGGRNRAVAWADLSSAPAAAPPREPQPLTQSGRLRAVR